MILFNHERSGNVPSNGVALHITGELDDLINTCNKSSSSESFSWFEPQPSPDDVFLCETSCVFLHFSEGPSNSYLMSTASYGISFPIHVSHDLVFLLDKEKPYKVYSYAEMSCKILLSLIMVAPMSDLMIHRCWELLHVFDSQ